MDKNWIIVEAWTFERLEKNIPNNNIFGALCCSIGSQKLEIPIVYNRVDLRTFHSWGRVVIKQQITFGNSIYVNQLLPSHWRFVVCVFVSRPFFKYETAWQRAVQWTFVHSQVVCAYSRALRSRHVHHSVICAAAI